MSTMIRTLLVGLALCPVLAFAQPKSVDNWQVIQDVWNQLKKFVPTTLASADPKSCPASLFVRREEEIA